MKKEPKLIVNKWKCKDGEILNSRSRHDYQMYLDSKGEFYCVDGGLEYIRHSGNMECMCVYSTDSHEKIRDNFEWTSYGIGGNGPTETRLLKDLTSDHICAILDTQNRLPSHIRQIFQDELLFRRYNPNENI